MRFRHEWVNLWRYKLLPNDDLLAYRVELGVFSLQAHTVYVAVLLLLFITLSVD